MELELTMQSSKAFHRISLEALAIHLTPEHLSLSLALLNKICQARIHGRLNKATVLRDVVTCT